MRKVIHFTTVHNRYDVRIFHKQCRSIAAQGYDLTLVLQDGHGDEYRDGTKILDLGPAPSGRVKRILLSPWKVYRSLRRMPADIYHFHDPELLPVGFLLKRRKHHVIYDSHDDIARDILFKYWIPFALRKLLSFLFEKLENFIAKRLDAVVCATPFITRRFRQINPNCVTINNFPIQDEFKPADESRPFSRTICYIGLISGDRGITQLVEAVGILRDVKLIICGPLERKTYGDELFALPGWKFVDYRGIVGRDEVRKILACSSLGMLTFLPKLNHTEAQPNKMFEYMAAGLPLVASDFPYWRKIIEKNRCGICVDPSVPEKIAQAIAGLFADEALCRTMGRAGRAAVESRYNWKNQSKKLLALYANIE